MGKVHVGIENQRYEDSVVKTAESSVERVVYVDRPVDVIVEKPVFIDREVVREVVKEVEKRVEVPRIVVEHKTVEIPVMVEKIVRVPVEKEVIREVLPKVVDITAIIELKKQKRLNSTLKIALVISLLAHAALAVLNG